MIQRKFIFMLTAAALLLFVIGVAASSPARADSAESEKAGPAASQQAVAALVTDFIKAWNGHDGKALGQVFTEDGDFVGIAGRMWHGPAEVTRVHTEQFAGRYDRSVIAVDQTPSVAFIKPDVALVHWRWTMSGVRDTDGSALSPYSGIFTWVVVNRDGAWRVRAAQNNVTK